MRERKPCPGCDKISVSRPADKVCRDCAEFIKLGQALLEKEDKSSMVAIPSPTWWPKYYGRSNFKAEELALQVGEAIHALTRKPRLHQHSQTRIPSKNADYSHSWWETVFMSKSAAEKVDKLDQGIRKALDDAFVAGFNEGSDLLKRLAAGDLTSSDFNEQVLELSKPKDKRTRY